MRAPHTITSLAVIAAAASGAATPATSAQAATQRHNGPVAASAKRKSRYTGPVAASIKRKSRYTGPVLALTNNAGGPVSLAATAAKLLAHAGYPHRSVQGSCGLTRGPEFISRRHRRQLMSTSATCIGDIEYRRPFRRISKKLPCGVNRTPARSCRCRRAARSDVF